MVNFPVLHSWPQLANVSGELFKFLDEGLVTTDFSFWGAFVGFPKILIQESLVQLSQHMECISFSMPHHPLSLPWQEPLALTSLWGNGSRVFELLLPSTYAYGGLPWSVTSVAF